MIDVILVSVGTVVTGAALILSLRESFKIRKRIKNERRENEKDFE